MCLISKLILFHHADRQKGNEGSIAVVSIFDFFIGWQILAAFQTLPSDEEVENRKLRRFHYVEDSSLAFSHVKTFVD